MDERINKLYNELIKIITPDTVFACIGAVKTTSYIDSIGPQIGDLLKAVGIPYVYGTHANPYNGLTSEKMNKTIKKYHKNNNVIAIDTCCTKHIEKLYKIVVENGSIAPGAGVDKKLSRIGNYAIKAFALYTEDLDLIYNGHLYSHKECDTIIQEVDDMVYIISTAIIKAYKYVVQQPTFDIIEKNNKKNKINKMI